MAEQEQRRIHSWLTLLANLGVVLGLTVVIFEVRQDASLTRLSIETAKNDLLANIEFSLADPAQTAAWVKSYRTPEMMTEAELRRIESHFLAILLQWDYLFQMESRGLVSVEEVKTHVSNAARPYFGSRFAKAWFEQEMEHWQGTPMLEIAGPIIADVDPDYMQMKYSRLLELAVESMAEFALD